MDRNRRERLVAFTLLPAVVIAVGVLGYFTLRTTLQLESLRQQSVLEATLALATEKADRLDARIVEQDNVVRTVGDPSVLAEIGDRWLPTAQRETPTVRAILVLNERRDVLVFASRASADFAGDEAFRRLLGRQLVDQMELEKEPRSELRHLHQVVDGRSYLLSYWQRAYKGRTYLVIAWHDLARIVKYTLPNLYTDAKNAPANRVNVVDEDGRIVFGPPLASGQFTVGVRFPTTLYNWRLQVSPASSAVLTSRVEKRRLLELVMVVLSCVVIVAGAATILVAAERERRISRLKSEFVANVSHELKTPLALVRMFAEMLQSGRIASDEKRQQYLDIIVNETERLSNLIENVLDFAKVERGRSAFELAEGPVEEAVRRAVQVYRYRAEREGVDVQLEIEPGLPPIENDPRAIQLAVINLLDNALKYGRGAGVVRTQVKRSGRKIFITVIDDGPGVPEDDRGRIFERFVRGAPPKGGTADEGAKPRGSGIGLSIVKHVAEGHGGSAWVEPARGDHGLRGAAFTIALPIR